MRDVNNAKKLEPLKTAFGDLYDQIEFVNADLLDAESILQAVKGSDFVVHTASPVVLKNPADHMDVIRPAVNGVVSVLKAA